MAIAVLAMAGRFPGAASVEELWVLLRDGREAISFLSDAELLEAGVPAAALSDPRYVKARGVLPGAERFDAELFGFTPQEAAITAPDHRLLLECAAESLERAGYDSQRYGGRIGIFAGCGVNYYLVEHVLRHPEVIAGGGELAAVIANDKDHLCSRIAYKLNLTGAAVTVQTACSSSLVSVHLACQNLLAGECDLALAGGASVALPADEGYWYQEEGTRSPDGHCRPFDAHAAGTVTSSGAAMVLLKRLDDARRDRDSIEAVIKASAVNNDGARRVGYTAPGVNGQTAVVAEALALAGIPADAIGFVEAHGTGTRLGDPIEVAALTAAFRQSTREVQFCALGSIKSNLGHLDAAAGATGLIKAVLALHHRQIPPTLHFRTPNPALQLSESPFFVNTRLIDWVSPDAPRRAGVSAFGIGGTNVHVVLEEAPAPPPPAPSRPFHVLPWSAKNADALDAIARDLTRHLEGLEPARLADLAYTLAVGRREHPCRRAIVCRDVTTARQALTDATTDGIAAGHCETGALPLLFMYPGQGTQYAGMTLGLYDAEPVFRNAVDACATALLPHLGVDVREAMYAAPGAGARAQLDETATAQGALFAVQYAITQLLAAWGIRPAAVVGHSVGECAAACAAGVLSIEDALAVLAARARVMRRAGPGAMLAVYLPEEQARRMLPATVSLAALNAPDLCTVAGNPGAVESWRREVEARGIRARMLPVSCACHSAALDPVLPDFRREVEKVRPNPPVIPMISTVTGARLASGEATDPEYWVRQLRQPVRFFDAIRPYASGTQYLLIEVGPGETLTSFAAAAAGGGARAIPIVPGRASGTPDLEQLLQAVARLWTAGVSIDWDAFYRDQRRSRVRAPGYPLNRRRHWLDRPRRPPAASADAAASEPRLPRAEDDPDAAIIARQIEIMRAQLRAVQASNSSFAGPSRDV